MSDPKPEVGSIGWIDLTVSDAEATEREPVEIALDMIAFRRELIDGTRALSGLQIDSIR